ncbi:ANTAR domain protein [Kribbella flavida DSM 17836]|uniref:ANTAR domain protein n=1 Tax=Kribbella flavida (strain DSM 17836 / JCM 10339 / NBRC 14399) TaxID=479435 RepID=D2Q2T9_KRIFD|nr:ANTAR domain-containing protein [Kribbella flavida]ADB30270.1 ANTAR domain protein [Kribbella flavida DSM 17836]
MTDHAAILAQLARLAAADAKERHLAERLCEASRLILGVTGASITVDTATSNRITLASSDEVAARLEDLQELLGQGPCREAFQTGLPVTVDLGEQADERWPEFTRAAREAVGELRISCFPMRPSRQSVFGTLSLYVTEGDTLPESTDTAQFLADAVGAALLRDPTSEDGVTGGGAWSARAQIHQATGMVIAQLRLSTDDALAILRAHAYAHDTTLSDIAAKVVRRELDFTEGIA